LGGYCQPRMDTAIKLAHGMGITVSRLVEILATVKK